MQILSTFVSNQDVSYDATYTCYMSNTWSGDRHPIGYDAIQYLAHLSRPVLVSHSQAFDLWHPYRFASEGVEDVAETGDTGTLEAWLKANENIGFVADVVVGEDHFNTFDSYQEFPPFHLSQDWPLISTISKLDPSPDWFTGISGFSPISEDGFWYEMFTITTDPWDAGTKQGETYSYSSSDEPVQHAITPLNVIRVPDSGILLDPTQTTVLPVAEWTCDLWTQIPCDDDDSTEWPSVSYVTEFPTDFPTVADVTESPSISHRDVTDFPTESPSMSHSENTWFPSMSWSSIPKTNAPTDFDSCLPFLSACTVDDNCCSGICVLGTCCKPARSDSHKISHGEGTGDGERTSRIGGHIRRLEGDTDAEEVSDETTAGLLRGFQR